MGFLMLALKGFQFSPSPALRKSQVGDLGEVLSLFPSSQVNLHDPVMLVQHLPEVVERANADVYAIVRVEDPDPAPHGNVASVEIIEGDSDARFRIRRSPEDAKEFSVEVARPLDREASPGGYNLTLKAVDAGMPPRTYYKNVHVSLTDVNDHAPVFSERIYDVRVDESAPPGTALARLKVSDEDYGRNARVRLSLAGGNEDGNFRVDAKSGVLYVAKKLDAEDQASHVLTVAALDSANAGARRQSSAKVRVLVQDVNDNEPTFGPGRRRMVPFDENQPPGSVVTRLEASDADSGENGRVSYSLANVEPVPFEVDAMTGAITATRLLDYETDPREYRLVVRASDWGEPFRRETELVLVVRLRDINDNRPQFERVECAGDVPRDTPAGSEVLTLSALDFDAGNVISYRVVAGNADGCFGLDPSRGVISVLCDLRTLPTRTRVLNVTATDGQHFSDVTPVTLRLGGGGNAAPSSGVFPAGVYSARGAADVLFECRETGVARRLAEAMAEAARANDASASGSGGDPALQLSRARPPGNLHRPEFDRASVPRVVRVNESLATGATVLKVSFSPPTPPLLHVSSSSSPPLPRVEYHHSSTPQRAIMPPEAAWFPCLRVLVRPPHPIFTTGSHGKSLFSSRPSLPHLLLLLL